MLFSGEYRGVLVENFRFLFYFLTNQKKKYFIICHRRGGQGGFDKCQTFFFLKASLLSISYTAKEDAIFFCFDFDV